MTDTFDKAFALVVDAEGGYTTDPRDKGNYTPKGDLKGTKYGISAAAYPTVDIANLTLDAAKVIYKRDYWDKLGGDNLPAPVAVCVFDAAVNSGPDRAAKWLQLAAGVAQDGMIGPRTLVAVAGKRALDLVTECNAQRLLYLASLPAWRTYGLGWTRRIVHLGVAAVAFDDPAAVPAPTPAPILASLEDVRTAFREIQSQKVAA